MTVSNYKAGIITRCSIQTEVAVMIYGFQRRKSEAGLRGVLKMVDVERPETKSELHVTRSKSERHATTGEMRDLPNFQLLTLDGKYAATRVSG
jgi:hypothetical protein